MQKNNILRTNILYKLDEIYKCIQIQLNNKDHFSNYSLYGGHMGALLFIAQYSKFSKDQNINTFFDLSLSTFLEAICSTPQYLSFSGGICGILYGINFLNKWGMTDIDSSEIHDIYSSHIKQFMFNKIDSGYFDFLHGSIGVAIYLLENNNDEDFSDCIKLVDKLEAISIENNGVIKWIAENSILKTKKFNISMSHGMSSIAIFFCRMISKNLDVIRCSQLLRKTINYILQQKIDIKKYGSLYPSYSIESEIGKLSGSRLGWCYGDLGIALALWQSGNTLNNELWKAEALEIFECASKRTNLLKEKVFDASICHGTIGIAHIFKRMYIETGNELFQNSHIFWLKETLKMGKLNDGYAGYKQWNNLSSSRECQIGLLEGIAGIGLSLISSISPPKFSDWDQVLLMHSS